MMTRSQSAESQVGAARLAPPLSPIDFGHEICCSPSTGADREWLVTNGIGGFGSGAVAGCATRHYHGLLVAALDPQSGRTLLVAKLQETAQSDGAEYPLSLSRWVDGKCQPSGVINPTHGSDVPHMLKRSPMQEEALDQRRDRSWRISNLQT